MGKKRNAPGAGHATQSFGQMVSKAALTQMLPAIEQMVENLGSRIARQQARSYELVLSRILVIERILMEKHGFTDADLANKFADMEDERARQIKVDEVKLGDTVRLEIKTKMTEQKEYQGTTRIKLDNAGSGNTIGTELEKTLIGMKANETKETTFGEKNEMQASITINRISRPIDAPVVAPTPATENTDANPTAG